MLTFRQLSRHPDIVEAWNNYHSIPLNETVLMVVFLDFHDHWMPRYLTKRCVKCWFVDISSIISASRHRRNMKQLPFDSSQWDGSNGSIFKFLRPLDAEIFDEKVSGAVPKCVKMLIWLIFCLIIWHPMVIERWKHYHSTVTLRGIG